MCLLARAKRSRFICASEGTGVQVCTIGEQVILGLNILSLRDNVIHVMMYREADDHLAERVREVARLEVEAEQ
jgi:hypothetical protein